MGDSSKTIDKAKLAIANVEGHILWLLLVIIKLQKKSFIP